MNWNEQNDEKSNTFIGRKELIKFEIYKYQPCSLPSTRLVLAQVRQSISHFSPNRYIS
jgi:hypothetical protein